VASRSAGECTGLVAEQFRFEQFVRDCGGIERDERLRRASAFAMQRARDQLLAGAGLAGDQYRQAARCDLADRAEQLAHHGAAADQAVVGRGRTWHGGSRHDGAFGQRAVRRGDRQVQIERLGQVIECAKPVSGRGGRDIGECAHHDHRETHRLHGQSFEQLQAAGSGHAHIGEQQIRRRIGERGERSLGILERTRMPARLAQRCAQHHAHRAIVVDDPYGRVMRFHRHALFRAIASTPTRNRFTTHLPAAAAD
jgi:hypothetical protein